MFHQLVAGVHQPAMTGRCDALRARKSVSESPSCSPERYVATTVEWSRHPGLANPRKGATKKTDPVNEHLWKPTIFYRYPLGI